MSVGSESLVELSKRIAAQNSEEREAGAENASDWAALFSDEEAEAVARLLAQAASIESDTTVRESQLHAILEISDHRSLPPVTLNPLTLIARDQLDEEQLSYLSDLGIRLPDGKEE